MPTKQIPLLGEIGSKYNSNVLDISIPAIAPYYLNGFFETNNFAQDEMQKISYCQRPGTLDITDEGMSNLSGLTNNYKIQGMVSSIDRSKLLFYVNNGAANIVFYYDASTNTLTNKGTAPAAAGNWSYTAPVVFSVLDGISYGSNVYYAVTDFTKGAVINSTGTWTEITDADFTGLTKVTNILGMDGYLFIGTSNNRLYNSDLNAGATWTATSFLTVADTPGALVWLAKIRNYLIVFKEHSIEFFQDTGEPTPGSPLSAQKQLNIKVGCISRSSIKEVSDGIIFIGTSEGGRVQMYKLGLDLRLKVISNYYIDQLLSSFIGISGPYSVEPKVTTINSGESQVIFFRGKEFYLICLRDGLGSGYDRTWVYDNSLNTWIRWATCLTAQDVLDENFTPTQSTQVARSGRIHNVMAQNFLSSASVKPFFVTILADDTFYGDAHNDAGSYYTYPMYWVSENFTLGTRKRKFLDSFEVLFEAWTGATPGERTGDLTLYYRDSDYNTQSPNVLVTRPLSYNIGGNNDNRAIARRLGQFRKRNFVVKYIGTTNATPFKILGIEINYNLAEQDQEG